MHPRRFAPDIRSQLQHTMAVTAPQETVGLEFVTYMWNCLTCVAAGTVAINLHLRRAEHGMAGRLRQMGNGTQQESAPGVQLGKEEERAPQSCNVSCGGGGCLIVFTRLSGT